MNQEEHRQGKPEAPEPQSQFDNAIKSEQANCPGPQQKNPAKPFTTRTLNLFFTGTVAFFTAVLTVVSIFQWSVMQQGLYVSERAYIVVKPGPLQDFAQGKIPNTYIFIENYGHTPAHHVTHWAGIAIGPYPLKKGDTLPKLAIPELPQTTIHPGLPSVPPVNLKGHLSESEFNEIKLGEHRRLYLWGVVDYQDAFQVWHRTNFCFAYGGEDTQTVETCPIYNWAN